MPERQPDTETITATDARQHFASVINRVARKEARVVIEKSGVPVAAIVSTDDLKRLDRLDAERERDFQTLAAIGERFRDVPIEELEQHVAEALAEVRAEMQAERERPAAATA